MKDLKEVNCLTVDYGTFADLAVMMAPHVKNSYFYSPFESEYLDIQACCLGDGLPQIERVDDYMDPDFIKDIDLVIFPDRGYPGMQKYLRSIGKKVWGSFGVCEQEEYRTLFLDTLKELGLPVLPSVEIRGLTTLSEHLKKVENKWVKIDRFRGNMETWHHVDYEHSARTLDGLRFTFGPLSEWVRFVVQDALDEDEGEPVLELGYDGWSVKGQFPSKSFAGYERKNELYLGACRKYDQLPECVRFVNERFAPVLESAGYCNFFATEIRKKGDVEVFIDPTTRHAGQTQEHLWNTCRNLPQVIWKGAHGEMVDPDFSSDFALEATLHYTADTKDGWRSLRIPEEVRPYVKLYHFCGYKGMYHFPPGRNDEVGVICGNGDTMEEAFDDLKDHISVLDKLPLKTELKGFADLVKQIQDAEDSGVEFSDQTPPEPAVALS